MNQKFIPSVRPLSKPTAIDLLEEVHKLLILQKNDGMFVKFF